MNINAKQSLHGKANIGYALKGEDGATFIPVMDADGNLSWTNDKHLENPTPINLKGPKGDPGPQGVLKVIITAEPDGSYSTSHNGTEIYEYVQAGGYAIAILGDVCYQYRAYSSVTKMATFAYMQTTSAATFAQRAIMVTATNNAIISETTCAPAISVNNVTPDAAGNISINALPDNIEQIDMLIEADLLPAIHAVNGAILTDEKGNVILRY